MGFNILSLTNREVEDVAEIAAGQSARVHGRQGLFFVVHVDEERHTADLISVHGICPVLREVPMASLEAIVAPIQQAGEGVSPSVC